MGNLVLFYGNNKNIKKIVAKYREMFKASSYSIETTEKVSIIKKFKSVYSNLYIPVKRCTLNLANYETIILVSELWYDQIPSPVLRFLEQQTGKIHNIIYVLYNNNKEDKQKEFDKMDNILNLRRMKAYFVTVTKKDIHVRVYQ